LSGRHSLCVAGLLTLVVIGLLVAVTTGLLGQGSVDFRADAAANAMVRHHHSVLIAAKDVTRAGAPIVVDVVAVVVTVALLLLRRPVLAAYVLIVRIATQLISSCLKTAVGRHRPVVGHPVAIWHGDSFPSGHAAGAASVYLPLALILVMWLKSKWRQWAIASTAAGVCLVVAASRVLLGAHYPSDVVAGLALGAAIATAAWAAVVWIGPGTARPGTP
jgi:undecaprenyl-diphosphatase